MMWPAVAAMTAATGSPDAGIAGFSTQAGEQQASDVSKRSQWMSDVADCDASLNLHVAPRKSSIVGAFRHAQTREDVDTALRLLARLRLQVSVRETIPEAGERLIRDFSKVTGQVVYVRADPSLTKGRLLDGSHVRKELTCMLSDIPLSLAGLTPYPTEALNY